MVAEFDDSALMKAFGKQGAGIFIAPSAIENEVTLQYQAKRIGRVEEIKEEFYAISVERRILHPVVSMIMETARETLFAEQSLDSLGDQANLNSKEPLTDHQLLLLHP